MKGPARVFLICAAGLIFFGFLISSRIPGGLELRLASVKDRRIDLRYPLQPGERFTIQYVHSVSRMPVWDVLYADGAGCLYIEETRFVSFNAGMDHWPGHGVYGKRGDYQVLENIHKPLCSFILRVGNPGADHTLMWRGRSTNLSALAAGIALEVKAQKISQFHRLRFFFCARPSGRTP